LHFYLYWGQLWWYTALGKCLHFLLQEKYMNSIVHTGFNSIDKNCWTDDVTDKLFYIWQGLFWLQEISNFLYFSELYKIPNFLDFKFSVLFRIVWNFKFPIYFRIIWMKFQISYILQIHMKFQTSNYIIQNHMKFIVTEYKYYTTRMHTCCSIKTNNIKLQLCYIHYTPTKFCVPQFV